MSSKSKISGVFSKGFKPDKCKTALKLAMARMKLMRNKREVTVKQMRREVSQLLETGQDQTARIRVEHVIREEKTMSAYELIELYCELIVARMNIIEGQKGCPIDLKEAVASIVFASPRCADIPELTDVRKHFSAKYGKDLINAALEVRPDSGVSPLVVEKLSAKAPNIQTKVKVLTAIAEEHNIKWEAKGFEEQLKNPHSDLLAGPTTFPSPSPMVHQPPPAFLSASQIGMGSGQPPPVVVTKEEPIKKMNENFAAYVPTGPKSFPGEILDASRSSLHARSQSGSKSSEKKYVREETDPYSREDISPDRPNYITEFKDAASAAQAAAESAEMASIAARAAAQLARRGDLSRENSTASNISYTSTNIDSPRKPEIHGPSPVQAKPTGETSFDSYRESPKKPERYEDINPRPEVCNSPPPPPPIHFPSPPPPIHSPSPPPPIQTSNNTEKWTQGGMYAGPASVFTSPPGPLSPSHSSGSGVVEEEDLTKSAPERTDMRPFEEEFSDNNDEEEYGYSGFGSEDKRSESGSTVQQTTIWDYHEESYTTPSIFDSAPIVFDQYDEPVHDNDKYSRTGSVFRDSFSQKSREESSYSPGFSSDKLSSPKQSRISGSLFSANSSSPFFTEDTDKRDPPPSHLNESSGPNFDSDGNDDEDELDLDKPVHIQKEEFEIVSESYETSSSTSVIKVKEVVPSSDDRYVKKSALSVRNKQPYRTRNGDKDLRNPDEMGPAEITSKPRAKVGKGALHYTPKESDSDDDSDDSGVLDYNKLIPRLRNKGGYVRPPYAKKLEPSLNYVDEKAVAVRESADMSVEENRLYMQERPKYKDHSKVEQRNGNLREEEEEEEEESISVTEKPAPSRYHKSREDSGDWSESSYEPKSYLNWKSRRRGKETSVTSSEEPTVGVTSKELSTRVPRDRFGFGDSETRNIESPRFVGRRVSGELKVSYRTREVPLESRKDSLLNDTPASEAQASKYSDRRRTPPPAPAPSETVPKEEIPATASVVVTTESLVSTESSRSVQRGNENIVLEKEKKMAEAKAKEGSLKGPSHIHPNLPVDFDSFAARLQSLQSNQR